MALSVATRGARDNVLDGNCEEGKLV